MLLQRDSKLYIMPASGGTPRLMNCNTENMNSWHSWSPNSKWLVFSSKGKGPYTQLYLTHIDGKGNDSPPVFLENMTFSNKAANIPEFYNHKFPGLNNMADDFSRNAVYSSRLASLSYTENKYKDALKNIEEAIKADSSFYEAYEIKLSINSVLGCSGSKNDLRDRKTAKRLIEKQIRQNPGNKSLYIKRGHLRLMMDDHEGALQDGMYLLKSNANKHVAYNLITDVYQKTGQFDQADASIYCSRGIVFQQVGNLPKALNDLSRAILLDAANYNFFNFRSAIKYELGDQSGYIADLKISASLLDKLQKKRKLNAQEQEALSTIQKVLSADAGMK